MKLSRCNIQLENPSIHCVAWSRPSVFAKIESQGSRDDRIVSAVKTTIPLVRRFRSFWIHLFGNEKSRLKLIQSNGPLFRYWSLWTEFLYWKRSIFLLGTVSFAHCQKRAECRMAKTGAVESLFCYSRKEIPCTMFRAWAKAGPWKGKLPNTIWMWEKKCWIWIIDSSRVEKRLLYFLTSYPFCITLQWRMFHPFYGGRLKLAGL